jgi:hypothetical protein
MEDLAEIRQWAKARTKALLQQTSLHCHSILYTMHAHGIIVSLFLYVTFARFFLLLRFVVVVVVVVVVFFFFFFFLVLAKGSSGWVGGLAAFALDVEFGEIRIVELAEYCNTEFFHVSGPRIALTHLA